jgi:iron-sulfur cluster repair protein YtfE (RIC family)
MMSPADHERRGRETKEAPVSLTGNTIDVSDMFPVHNTLRDSLAAAPRLVSGVDDDDGERRQLIANFYDNVLAFLHVHHHGEEILVFPLLRERCADQLEMIDVVAGQHRDVDRLVAESGDALKSWQGGDVAAKDRSARALGALGGRMTEHLHDEEQQLLPLCSTNLTEQEWGALPGHALGSFEGDKVWLILGLIRERMTDEQRAAMLAHMPPPAVEMWTTVGEKSFVELMGSVGPLT